MHLMYRVTHQVVQNLPLTSKKKFSFGLARPGQARPKQNFTFEVNRRVCTRRWVTLYKKIFCTAKHACCKSLTYSTYQNHQPENNSCIHELIRRKVNRMRNATFIGFPIVHYGQMCTKLRTFSSSQFWARRLANW